MCASPFSTSLLKAGAITELVLDPYELQHGAWYTELMFNENAMKATAVRGSCRLLNTIDRTVRIIATDVSLLHTVGAQHY